MFLGRDILMDTHGVWHSGDWLRMAETVLKYFMMAVTLIVMSVPEGMPMAVTLSLALNMRRMLKNNNLVRKLHACETMGAVTVICTDKTGTLTQNKMQVAEMVAWGEQPLLDKAIAMNTTANLDESGDKGIGPAAVDEQKWTGLPPAATGKGTGIPTAFLYRAQIHGLHCAHRRQQMAVCEGCP